MIATLTSNDDKLRYFDTSTGEHLASVELWPDASSPGLFGQSLRGSIHTPGEVTVLASNYNDDQPLEMVKISQRMYTSQPIVAGTGAAAAACGSDASPSAAEHVSQT